MQGGGSIVTSIDISHLDYAELLALRDSVNRRILALRRTPTMRLDELLSVFEETREALSNRGLRWHSLERWQWIDGEVRFWLNPVDSNRYMVGWFTIDDLIAWLSDHGPIVRDSIDHDGHDVPLRWIDVEQ
jgi:hypothetical protein